MTEISEKIEAALETIRPYLKTDGGDVKLVEVTADMEVKVRLLGACKTCSMSEMTMKAGIEDAVRKAVPGVKSIIAVK